MRIRNKLLLAMMVAVGLLIIQIAAVSFSVRELQSAVGFISSGQTVIEADFVAAELVTKLREEIKRLPSTYVTEKDPAEAAASSKVWDGLVSQVAFIRSSNAAHAIDPQLLERLDLAFTRVQVERVQTISLAGERADLDRLIERAILTDKALVALANALNALAVELRRQLQLAVEHEREIHSRPLIAGATIGGLAIFLLLSFTWLYVDRRLVVRLTALSRSMLALADGNLKAPLPETTGRDEIAGMANALRVFRNTAVEVEEQSLRERQVVLDTINYGVLILDPELRVRMYNRAFRDLASLPDDYLLANPSMREIIEISQRRGILGVSDEVRDEYVARRLAEVRTADQPPQEWRWPDGRVLEYEVVSLPDGGRMVTYFDLTRLKRAEAELRAAKDQAERANQTKSAFLASMSHELRTPLNAIIGFTRLVMRRSKDVLAQKQYENLEKILVSAEHLLGLINSVLDLSKIEAGRMDIRPTEFRLQALLDVCVKTTEPLIRGERISLITDLEDVGLVLFTDQDKLKQILLNLLSNAGKFTEVGEIVVSARAGQGKLRLAVRDTGAGIPKSALDLIFEEFRQIDGGSARSHQGTGLGLSISRHLAALLGGELTVESEVGVGSTFTLVIPVKLDAAPIGLQHLGTEPTELVAGMRSAVHADPGKEMVLAIDDDPNVIYLLTENLSDAGYRVIGAQNAEEGLRKARELMPRAIILDIVMPEADGWQVLHALKADERTRDIPVIVLSVVDQKALGFRLGAADFLLKPFDRDALIATLTRVAPQCRRVLLVDDDPNVAELVRQLLEGAGCEIAWASDGLAALASLAGERPDVILLDLLMPRMDGLRFLDELSGSANHRDIPVIVLTAKRLDNTERKLLEERVHGLIEKHGLDRETLMREVRRAIPACAA